MKHSVLRPPIPRSHDNRVTWSGLSCSSAALALSELIREQRKTLLVVTDTIQTARQFQQALNFFKPRADIPVLLFPDWETLPYDHFSPHADLISERLLTLHQVSHLREGFVIVSLPTLMHRLPPNHFVQAHTLNLRVGQPLDLLHFRDQLSKSGYRHAEQVMEHGEFALRGSILDIFPMGNQSPYRIECFDTDIESIRLFDPDTQRSQEKVAEIRCLPAREYPLTDDSISHFRSQWRARFSGNPTDSPIYVNISQGEASAGIEYYLPLFFDTLETLFDYLPVDTQLAMAEINSKTLHQAAEQFWQESSFRYEQLRYDNTRPLCAPEQLFLTVPETFSQAKRFAQLVLKPQTEDNSIVFATCPAPDVRLEHKAAVPMHKLLQLLEQTERSLICAESNGRREILLDLLQEYGIRPQTYPSWQSFIDDHQPLGITVTPIDDGFYLQNPNVALVTEAQLFGEQVQQRRLRQRTVQDPATLIKDLSELRIGSPVVHLQHGVARYQGLKHITTDNVTSEYLVLVYANDDVVYVPVSSLHLISRYSGLDERNAPLHRLGSSQWQKAKSLAAKRCRDVAAELLNLYGQREASKGFCFTKPAHDYDLFCASFPFEETPDQLQAIHAVISDMTSERTMDRLVCGDVGFGKTEVAIRAAFIAVQSGKQVAVLVPTTLLANQHAQNFQDRFAEWPVKIACLSRMRSAKEQQQALEGLNNGSVDIVIGTHKLLQASVKFRDLGLLVVDEEHRFGVRDKEKIKALRAHVDILTLTATPIPRTLNMALSGTRDLSIIATPPARRLSVKTFVHEYEASLVREAILRENMRGGQVYFLHNRVETIHATAERLKQIVPDARIAIAHGQLPERELERVMADFYHQRSNILLCTTIIESGIDIPNANTIIIDRADHFGLAQLHQLRGRVGRSHHQAYAYLLIPDSKGITSDAKKRLEAISQLEELGAGFNLATHDLEIRGAGEFLGEQQSGHMQAIGFSLFMEMLEQAINAHKEGKTVDLENLRQESLEIDLHTSALIPESYVPDAYLRLTLYKRLSNCATMDALQEFKAELIDRFGPLPEEAKTLLTITDLKLKAAPLGIEKIDVGNKYGYIHFSDQANINTTALVSLIQQQNQAFQLQNATRLRFSISDNRHDSTVITQLHDLITQLSPSTNA